MAHSTLDPATAASQLDIVARELAALSERLTVAATGARGLAAATDWRARAAEAFHRLATQWAGEVSSLVCLAETARLSAARARDAALWPIEKGF
ncbi:hypothetical protein [Microbacterium sp. Root180]|uniref:hypothetical protein n=1 Tax=Microbacterium sp. Root180 TaxID=1736483 RepID=UPI0006F740CA|nr:hypothetical protein [Microbacterium sp. Root180]KRB36947.1 hypothetical protein ASD93_13105 [Microbacterium sp. Root180]